MRRESRLLHRIDGGLFRLKSNCSHSLAKRFGCQDVEHYTATINQRKVVVSVSGSLENEVHRIIDGMVQ